MAAFGSKSMAFVALALVVVFMGMMEGSHAQLSTNFYAKSCPKLLPTVKSAVQSAVSKERRMGASLLRLFFHDCFVNVILHFSISLLFLHYNKSYSSLISYGNLCRSYVVNHFT